MQLYNTKTRQLEAFRPLKENEIKIYSCGPTVYNYVHLGNLRTFVFEDIVVKTLIFLGYHVRTVMNITDVDDKTIRASMQAGEKLADFTQKYSDIFLQDIKKMGITPADSIVPVTTLIPEMVRMINTLLKRGFAYMGEDNSIYYKISAFKKYGRLANLKMEGLKANARVNNDEYDKESMSDFVLWKAYKSEDGEVFWEEAFEVPFENLANPDEAPNFKKLIIKGRPGWHIECSACNMKMFGQQIDIHMGGEDLIFPHHQNEIAQTEACTRKEFSKYWLHSGHLMVDGKKMSKSLGNFYTLHDIEQKYAGKIDTSVLYRAIRLSFINGKYSESIEFNFEKLESNINVIKGIDEAVKNLSLLTSFPKRKAVTRDFRDEMQNFIVAYMDFLEDDFNTVGVIALLHEFLKFVNIGVKAGEFIEDEQKGLIDMFKTFNQVLGIIDFDVTQKSQDIPQTVLDLLEARNEAKKSKDFSRADTLRDEMIHMGYKIVDSREGSRVERA